MIHSLLFIITILFVRAGSSDATGSGSSPARFPRAIRQPVKEVLAAE
jgi:hypothetical protein